MKNYIKSGKVLTLTAPYDVLSGAVAKVGGFIGVANSDYLSGAEGEFDIEGVFDLAKDSSVFAQGATIYWDNSAKAMTSTSSGNTKCGYAEVAALTGDTTVRMRLIPL